ncbi:MAG: DUF4388 domain-containing protein [Desulfatibacillaceae bacterium]
MSLKGNLDTFFFASVLQFLSIEKKTGILFVRDDSANEVRVYLREGTIVYATGSQKESRLAYLLRSRGVVSTEELKKCMETARDSKQPYGKVLVDKGLITPDMYRKFAKKQVEEIIYKLFLWKSGEFEYRDAQFNLDETLVVSLNTVEIILEASRRIDEMSILENQIPNSDMVFKISQKYPDQKEIKLTAGEWHVLSLIDGRRTIREVIEASGYDEFPVYKLLFSLLSSGLVEKTDEVGTGQDFFDMRGVITIYTDILEAVRKKAETELGHRALSMFDESKSRLSAKQRILLRNTAPTESTEKNVEAIALAAENLRKSDNIGPEFVIEAYNHYMSNLLNRLMDQLGQGIVAEVVDSVESVLAYVNTYQGQSGRKDMIIQGIRATLSSAAGPRQDGKARGGVLSMFKR